MTELADITDMSTNKITHSVNMVDAEMATRWLKRNVNNRKPRTARVLKYRDDMLSGRWTFAGDPIRFNVQGDLIDGQHRLLALADLPDVTIPMLVIRGLPSEAQSVMDQGAKRTPGDQLGMRGVKNASNVASAIKQFLIWERGYMFRDLKVAHAEISTPLIEQWAAEHSVEVEHLNESINDIRTADGRPSIGGAAFIAFDRVAPSDARLFFDLLAHGAGTEGHPINTLDKKLRRTRREGRAVAARDELASYIQAWNAWREGRSITRFMKPSAGWTTSNFPEPR